MKILILLSILLVLAVPAVAYDEDEPPEEPQCELCTSSP